MDNTHRKKVLFIANHKGFSKFNAPFMAWFKEQGWQVDNASPGIEIGDVDCQYDVDIQRTPFSWRNYRAYKRLKTIIELNHYDLIHVHTPMGAALGRLAAIKARKKGTKVIYTAHGFHFFKGAPAKNWLLFYPVEKYLSRYTDELLVINQEDYELAKKKFHMKQLTYIPGIGVNVTPHDMPQEAKNKKRQELGIPESAFLIVQVAEFTANKNQRTVIKALEKMKKADIYYVMCGIGPEKEELEQYVKEHHLEKNVQFAGFRSDVHEILQCADCFVLSSFREGLSVALMEAMTEGLPVVCSRIRGNVDLIEEGVGGYLVAPGEESEYRIAFTKLYEMKKNEPQKFEKMGQANQCKIKEFSKENVDEIMKKVYQV